MTIEKICITLKEANKNAEWVWQDGKGVCMYGKDGKQTLIENGKVLVDKVDGVDWYQLGVYKYRKDGKKTLVENGEVLIEGFVYVDWHDKGVFKYAKDGKRFEVKNGITTEIKH